MIVASGHRVWSGPAAAVVLVASLLLSATAGAFLPPVPPEGARLDPATVRLLEDAVERGVAQGPRTLDGATDAGAHALVLLVDFTDERWEGALHPPALYDSLLFGQGGRTVRRYYEEISRGDFTLTGRVVGPTRLPVEVARYTGDGYCDGCALGTGDYPYNAPALVEDLVRAVDGAVDFSRHDGDGDGEVDILYVVHAGRAYEDAPGSRRFLSHQWHTFDPPEVDGVRVTSYVIMSAYSGVGGFAHETAHLFGATDLYDLDGFAPSAGVGEWSLMAAGLRLGTPTYARPAHPDAWTRVRMGFDTARDDLVVGPEGEVRLAPVATGGDIFRVWTAGQRGPEYFLLEVRRRDLGLLFDTELPGEGLLVYHVDERVASNRDPARYRVAVEQADGLFELEMAGPRMADAGDPFPGDSLTVRLDADTVPSSRDNDGRPTGVTLSDIREEDDDVLLTVRLTDGPWLEVDDVSWTELTGDGDLRPEPGEAWTISPVLRNAGDGSGPLTVEALLDETAPAGVSITPDAVPLDAVPAAGTVTLDAAFTVTFAGDVAVDPIAVPLRLVVDGDARTDTLEVPLLAGDTFGLTAGFEADDDGFIHERVALGEADPWHRTTADAFDGTGAMRAGTDGGDGIPTDVDAVLRSPPVLLGAGSTLRFRHRVDLELDQAGDAYDGARLAIEHVGGVDTLIPDGGYPREAVANADFGLVEGPVWSGRTDGWETVTVDLSRFDASAVRLRFRVATDRVDEGGPYSGWWIDDVRITTDDADAAVVLLEPGVDDDGVTMGFSLAENRRPFTGTITLERERLGPGDAVIDGPVLLATWSPDGSMRAEHVDAPLTPGETRRYRLWRDEGTRLLAGERTVIAPAAPSALTVLGAGPVPFRPDRAPFGLRIAPSSLGRAVLTVHDVTGRRVRAIDASLVPGAETLLTWDGRSDHGDPVGAGIFFYRLTSGGVARTGRIVLVR